jgi:hypothetical protein
MKYAQKMWSASFLCALVLFAISGAQAQVPDSGTDCNGTYNGTFTGQPDGLGRSNLHFQ